MTVEKDFGQISSDQLLNLIEYLPSIGAMELELRRDCKTDPNDVARRAPEGFLWSDIYEFTIQQHLALLSRLLGLEKRIKDASGSPDPTAAVIGLIDSSDEIEPDVDHSLFGKENTFTGLVSLLVALMRSLECVAVYGRYIHELVAEARSDSPGRDKALLCAIRIDPSVISGPTGSRRLSTAIVMDDQPFLAELRLAMEGKTGDQVAYLRKFRNAVKVLAESNALNGSPKALAKQLVEVGIYPAGPTATKNAAELIRKARKQNAI
jgi:hypothetical protein